MTNPGDIFGHPPVLSTEDRKAYDELMTQLTLEWKPRKTKPIFRNQSKGLQN